MLAVPRVRTLVFVALLSACHLGDLVSPATPTTKVGGDSTDTTTVVVTTLTLSPADTTLSAEGDTLCLRWTALDAGGHVVDSVTPTFSFTSNPNGKLGFHGAPGCVVVLVATNSGGPVTIHAVTDTATAAATVQVHP